MNRPAGHGQRSRARGQSITEFALVLPVLLALVGAGIDFARVYQAQITLEGATRDAAEYVATNCTNSDCTAYVSGASYKTNPQAIVCLEMANVPGFQAPPGNPANCTSPTVTSSWSAPASSSSPTSATVTSTFGFKMLFPWPLLPQGSWTLTASSSYQIIQGR